MNKSIISTDKAPSAIGTYSQATRHGNTVYISGQIPLDPTDMTMVEGGIDQQIHQVFKNLSAICDASGSDLGGILKMTVYLADFAHFPNVNKIMSEYFAEPYPARAAVEVSALPKGSLVEVDAILGL